MDKKGLADVSLNLQCQSPGRKNLQSERNVMLRPVNFVFVTSVLREKGTIDEFDQVSVQSILIRLFLRFLLTGSYKYFT
jgi:hypothetical protein